MLELEIDFERVQALFLYGLGERVGKERDEGGKGRGREGERTEGRSYLFIMLN